MARLVRFLAGMFRDERKNPSMARALLVVTVATALSLITTEALGRAKVTPEGYELLTLLITYLVAWAAGNRFASHILPQLRTILRRPYAAPPAVPPASPPSKPDEAPCDTELPPARG